MGTWDDSPAGSGLRSQDWELGMVSRASVRLTAALPWPHAAENEPIAHPDVEVQRQREGNRLGSRQERGAKWLSLRLHAFRPVPLDPTPFPPK